MTLPYGAAALFVSLSIILAATLGGATLPQALAPFEQEILTAHNEVRASLHERPLTWSRKLANVAQDWADRLAEQGEFYHRQNSGYGENLYMIRPGPAAPEHVVHAWAAEAPDYDHVSNSCMRMCGHYTQIVWRETSKVGCAVSRGTGREVWVCNYDPPGNWVGEKPY